VEPSVSRQGVEPDTTFHGLELPVRSVSGAKAVRVVHGPGQVIEAHDHDWACVTISVIGGALERWDGGEADLTGARALLHPPRADHADHVGDQGLETFSIQFDLSWIGAPELRLDSSRCWSGGAVSREARLLTQAWSRPEASEAELARATTRFLVGALTDAWPTAPSWLSHVSAALAGEGERPTTAALAAALDLHPAWLARAYRASTGEGLAETVRRRRVERAVWLLRRTALPLAQVAADTGFADQSHMNRDFRTLLGRTPLAVRGEGALLSPLRPTSSRPPASAIPD